MNLSQLRRLEQEQPGTLSLLQRDAALLDQGFMLLKADWQSRKVCAVAGAPQAWQSRPVIMAKYRHRRKWYVLEAKFRDAAHRDRRLVQLLELPKRAQRIV